MNDMDALLAGQYRFFAEGSTRDPDFRRKQLIKLGECFRKAEKHILGALHDDLGKSEFEAYSTELAVIYQELSICLKNLRKWASPVKVRTNAVNLPGLSRIVPEPLGTVLIIGAWNYPFQLTMGPLIPAMAAGNTVVLKPSELALNTSSVLHQIISAEFPEEYIHVVQGGPDKAKELLDKKFDKIFFTGSTRVGRIVAGKAAEKLTPVSLELGGKSPVLVAKDADLRTAARRIAWGKVLNAGQTCIAPDHIIAHRSVASALTELLGQEFDRYFEQDSAHMGSYPRIINRQHFHRLMNLIEEEKVCYGNVSDEDRLFLSPTILFPASYDDRSMAEEIFGPILPVIVFDDLDEALLNIRSKPRPLAFYLFSSSARIREKVLNIVSFGGGAVNDVIMHAANYSLPFGGVGQSGVGRYHGKAGFDEFSNFKSLLIKPSRPDLPFRYPPWSKWKYRLARWFFG